MPETMKVVLLGASGTLGTALLDSLLISTSPIFEITAPFRPSSPPSAHPFSSHPNLHPIPLPTPWTLPALTEIFTGHTAIISATGLSTLPSQPLIISACIAANIPRLITNDFANAPDFVGLPEFQFARAPKDEIFALVQHEALLHPGFTWTALATGHFLDYAIKKFPTAFGFDVAGRKARLVDGGKERFSATVLDDIGKAVVGVLRRLDRTANRYLLVRSVETTQREILVELERQTGTSWEVEMVESAVLYQKAKEMVGSAGDKITREAILQLLPVQIFERGSGRSTFPRERYDNTLLGVEERSVEMVVRDVLASM